MDASEKIVKIWLQVCVNRFTMEDIPYKRKRGYGDIDILAVDRDGKFYDYEVKGMTGYSSQKADIPWLIEQMTNKARCAAVLNITKKRSCQKFFISPNRFFGNKFAKWEKELRKKNIKIIRFEEVIRDIIKEMDKSGPYFDSETLQMIRLLLASDRIIK